MELAQELGFDRRACVEICIAASELAVNIAKYGVRGEVSVGEVDHPEWGRGIVIEASDCGPPFHDFALAVRDGCTDAGPLDPMRLLGRHGLGSGLGAVARFTDELACEPTEGGKRIRAVRYRRHPGRRSPFHGGSPAPKPRGS
jgi:anti-sigma regulatory factor (Ser/Thr protein kinase)